MSSSTADGACKDASTPSHRLHDLLSLGEVESALSSSTTENLPTVADQDGESNNNPQNDASLGIGLPLLLRWLAAAQPLASITPSLECLGQTQQNESSSEHSAGSSRMDPDSVVPLLEDVAASHPDAENVEVLVSTLAPSVCRDTISKLPILSRIKNYRYGNELGNSTPGKKTYCSWNTTSLNTALERLSNNNRNHHLSTKRQSSLDQDQSREAKRQKTEVDDVAAMSADEMEDIMNMAEQQQQPPHPPPPNKSFQKQLSETQDDDLANFFAFASSAANDSHESAMRKTLQELVVLVLSSLQTAGSGNGDDNDARNNNDGQVRGGDDNDGRVESSTLGKQHFNNPFLKETGFVTPGISVKSDSLFAETDAVASSTGGGWSKLSVMVPALMHHAPVLRHEHVANALCRSAVPQAPTLIMHMAANCPSAIPSLLRGCITAYQLAKKSESFKSPQSEDADLQHASIQSGPSNSEIISTSMESTKRLASLSRREALNVIRMLKDERVMHEIILDILIVHDSVGAASFIIENLSVSIIDTISASTSELSGAETTNHDVVDGRGVRRRRLIRKIPLKQRMVSHIRKIDETKKTCHPTRSQASPLSKILAEDRSLAEKARRCMSKCILKLTESEDDDISMGEASLFLKAYALLIHQSGVGAGSSAGSGSKFVEDSMSSILKLAKVCSKHPATDLPAESPSDNVYALALCASIITSQNFPPIGDTTGPYIFSPAAQACLDFFENILSEPAPSIKSVVFAATIAGKIMDQESPNLLHVIQKFIGNENFRDEDSMIEERVKSKLRNTCCWLLANVGVDKLRTTNEMGLSESVIVHDPTAFIAEMQRSCALSSNERLDGLVRTILSDPSLCVKISQHPGVGDFIEESVNMLVRRQPPHIPLVMPLSLERIAQTITWENVDGCKGKLLQFVFQLIYSLAFLDHERNSPFAIDHRSLPLKETLHFLVSNLEPTASQLSGLKVLHNALKELVSKFCPDVVSTMSKNEWIFQKRTVSITNHTSVITPVMVCNAIQECFADDASIEKNGMRAESMFLLCRKIYPWSELDVAVVCAILAESRANPKFVCYSSLIKDPLILLKAKAAVWKCRGTRRIMLRVLQNLIEANEAQVMNYATTDEVAMEFLASRDTIIVRCILFACECGFVFGDTKQENATPSHCVMSVNMIRCIVSLRRGIVATLIKQGLADDSVDWLVEYVPEALLDAPILLNMLSDRGALSPTDRLTTASATLRIAIANSFRGMAAAHRLVSVSLTTLIELFYLVNPVGIPVSVLREDDGRDITNICRKALFRMVNACGKIDPRANADIRNEAIVALSKIATTCKNESSGGVASRRKALLKEIWDACSQANTSLGGAMQF